MRAHHPDAPACRALPPELRHARFQAISSAYDALRGRTRAQGRVPRYDDAFYAEELDRRRRQHRRRAEYWSRYDQPGSAGARVHMDAQVDEGWKDQVIVIVGLAVRTVPPALYTHICRFIPSTYHYLTLPHTIPASTSGSHRGPRSGLLQDLRRRCTARHCSAESRAGATRRARVRPRTPKSNSQARRRAEELASRDSGRSRRF